jgi:hypothetical protein
MSITHNAKLKIIDDIKKLDIKHQKYIFILLKNNNFKYSKNKNGVFINFNNINDDLIENIYKYIHSIENIEIQQKTQITKEDIKLPLQNDIFENITMLDNCEFDSIYKNYKKEIEILNEINKKINTKHKIKDKQLSYNNKIKKYNRLYQISIMHQNGDYSNYENLIKEDI